MTRHEFLEKLKIEGYSEKSIKNYDKLITSRLDSGEIENDIIIDLVFKENQKLKNKGDEHKKECDTLKEDIEKRSDRKTLLIIAICLWPITLTLVIVAIALIVSFIAVVFSFLVAALAGSLWGIAAIIELIIYGASFQYIVFYLGFVLISIGVIGFLGWYGWKLIKWLYNLILPYFKKTNTVSEENKNEKA